MAYIIHKTVGENKDKGRMGFKFNYPFENCIFDITKQRFMVLKRSEKRLTDEELQLSFVTEAEWGFIKDNDKRWGDISLLSPDLLNEGSKE
jgi:hypothetical protein